MKIGNVEIENSLALGPMAGVVCFAKSRDVACFTRKW